MEINFLVIRTNCSLSKVRKKLHREYGVGVYTAEIEDLKKDEFFTKFKDNLYRYKATSIESSEFKTIKNIIDEEQFSSEYEESFCFGMDSIHFKIQFIFSPFNEFILGISTGQIKLQKSLFDRNLLKMIKGYITHEEQNKVENF
jgi:hypothetical protein